MPRLKFNFIKKLLLTFLTFSILLSSNMGLFAESVFAQGNSDDINNLWNHEWYSEQNPFTWYSKVYDESVSPTSEIYGERYTAAQVQWIIYSLWAHIWNYIPGNPELTTCLVNGSVDQCFEIFKKAMDLANPLVDSNSNTDNSLASLVGKNQISGIGYTQNLIHKFSPVKEVRAQGFGYNSGAKSIQMLWTATRNMSYALIVLAVIVMAFMIMFRVKISPQVVISVQSALPKIISATILITFSYAIAGFAIDLMYVVIGLLASLITTSGLSNHDFAFMFKELTTNHSAFSIMYQYWLAFVWSSLVAVFTSEWDFILGILVFLFAIISILAIIWWSIKIIFLIFKNFAMVMLTIVTGPLEILLGTVTQGSGFGPWFKKLISQLAVYPVLGLMFFLSFFFLWQGASAGGTGYVESFPFNPKQNEITDNEWKPPFSFGVFGAGGPAGGDSIMWVIVSFVIFSQITKVAEIIQAFIAGKPLGYGLDIGPVTRGYGSYAVSQFGAGAIPQPLGKIPFVRDFINKRWPETEDKSRLAKFIEGIMRAERG